MNHDEVRELMRTAILLMNKQSVPQSADIALKVFENAGYVIVRREEVERMKRVVDCAKDMRDDCDFECDGLVGNAYQINDFRFNPQHFINLHDAIVALEDASSGKAGDA